MTKETESRLAASGGTTSSPIDARVQALKGLTIGTLPVGSVTEVVLRGTLEAYGVDTDSEVTIRSFPDNTSVVAAARAGQVDAFFPGLTDPTLPISIDYSAGEVPAYKELSNGSIVTTRRFLESDEEAVRRYLSAEWAGWQRLQTDRAATLRVVKDKIFPNTDQAVFDLSASKVIAAMGDGLTSSPAGFETLLKVYNVSLPADRQVTLSYGDVYDTTLAKATKP